MKKMISALVILFAVSCAQYASACSQDSGSMTGGACSVKELQNLEKTKTKQESGQNPAENELRPVKLSPEKQKSDVGCEVFGLCLRTRLEGVKF